MKQLICSTSTGLLAYLISNVAIAQHLGGSVSVSSGESDNAFKSETTYVSERQDTFRLGIDGDYTNSFINATAKYTVEDRRFAKESQEDKTFVDGSSALLLGAATDPFISPEKH